MEEAMKRVLVFLALAACATPQERCINGLTGEISTLDRLIAESRAVIARGYGYQTDVVMMPDWVDCTPRPTQANPTPKARMCFEDVPQEMRRAVAVDLDAEQAKLASMERRRAEKARAVAPAIEVCRATYPE